MKIHKHVCIGNIICHQEAGGITHIALSNLIICIGIVTEVNNDGTYNLVKLESSTLLKNMKEDSFQIYQVYNEGTECLYQIEKETYVPITIVEFMRNSARGGFELHGSYRFTYDDFISSKNVMDEDNNNSINTVQEGRAMRMHRFMERDEV